MLMGKTKKVSKEEHIQPTVLQFEPKQAQFFSFFHGEIEARRKWELETSIEEMVVRTSIRADSGACASVVRPHLNEMNY